MLRFLLCRALWNIQSSWNGGYSACRGLESLGVKIAVLQDTKLIYGIYAYSLYFYSIAACNVPIAHQGMSALAWRPHDLYEIEEPKFWGSNVLALQLVMGGEMILRRVMLHAAHRSNNVGRRLK